MPTWRRRQLEKLCSLNSLDALFPDETTGTELMDNLTHVVITPARLATLSLNSSRVSPSAIN
jgi:hypothetical protein